MLDSFMRAEGLPGVHDGGSSSSAGISSSETLRGGFNRSRINRPRRIKCQMTSAPIAARATKLVPSKTATARPTRARAWGCSSRI